MIIKCEWFIHYSLVKPQFALELYGERRDILTHQPTSHTFANQSQCPCSDFASSKGKAASFRNIFLCPLEILQNRKPIFIQQNQAERLPPSPLPP